MTKGLQNLPASEQYDRTTSDTARVVGGGLGFSPKKIDHLIRGYTASIGRDVVTPLLDVPVRFLEGGGLSQGGQPDTSEAKDWTELPLIKGLFADSLLQSESVERFYDVYSDLQGQKALVGVNRKRGTNERPDGQVLAMAGRFDAANKQMSNIRTTMNHVRYNKTLSPEQKRKKLDELRRQNIDVSKRALEYYDKVK